MDISFNKNVTVTRPSAQSIPLMINRSECFVNDFFKKKAAFYYSNSLIFVWKNCVLRERG